MVEALFIVVRLGGRDEDGLVGRVALKLLPTEALLISRVQVEGFCVIWE